MKVGGQRLLVVPPEYAYGSRRKPPLVPPNATVEFAVSLLSVRRSGTNPNSVINIVRGCGRRRGVLDARGVHRACAWRVCGTCNVAHAALGALSGCGGAGARNLRGKRALTELDLDIPVCTCVDGALQTTGRSSVLMPLAAGGFMAARLIASVQSVRFCFALVYSFSIFFLPHFYRGPLRASHLLRKSTHPGTTACHYNCDMQLPMRHTTSHTVRL